MGFLSVRATAAAEAKDGDKTLEAGRAVHPHTTVAHVAQSNATRNLGNMKKKTEKKLL